MRSLASALGALLILVSLCGSALLVIPPPETAPAPLRSIAALITRVGGTDAAPLGIPVDTGPASPRPITRLVIPDIQMDTQVVESPLVERDGVTTWDVPPIVAGHAQGTPGAGESGNAVLLGHVTSLHLGNVFEQLNELRGGETILVYSDQQRFAYRVSEVSNVSRTATGVLDPTPTPTLTLVTCAGLWLATAHDYAERLIVHASLTGTV
ncbi:MAG: sortase [Chloroflexota bacterium]|nr:sortase [Chloroflexota bacterium]